MQYTISKRTNIDDFFFGNTQVRLLKTLHCIFNPKKIRIFITLQSQLNHFISQAIFKQKTKNMKIISMKNFVATMIVTTIIAVILAIISLIWTY